MGVPKGWIYSRDTLGVLSCPDLYLREAIQEAGRRNPDSGGIPTLLVEPASAIQTAYTQMQKNDPIIKRFNESGFKPEEVSLQAVEEVVNQVGWERSRKGAALLKRSLEGIKEHVGEDCRVVAVLDGEPSLHKSTHKKHPSKYDDGLYQRDLQYLALHHQKAIPWSAPDEEAWKEAKSFAQWKDLDPPERASVGLRRMSPTQLIRFAKNPNLCLGGNRRLRFYVSVPLNLLGKEDKLIPVGRFCLLSESVREWSDEDSELLKDLSTLTSDSLEKLQQTQRSKRMGVIQRSLTFLTRSIDESSLIDHSHCHGSCNQNAAEGEASTNSSALTSDGFSFCEKRVELACSSIKSVCNANSVLALDVSDFKISNVPSNPSISPRNSIFPLSPWAPMASPTSHRRSSTVEGVSSPNGRGRGGSAYVSGSHSHSRLHSIVSPFFPDETEICPVPHVGPSLISGAASNGVPVATLAKEFGNETQRTVLAAWFSRWKVDGKKSLPAIYENSLPPSSSESEEEGEVFTPSEELGNVSDLEQALRNPLSSLLRGSEDTEIYLALPIFNLNDQPMFIILVSFEKKIPLENESLLFCENAAMVIRSSILRQQIRAAEIAAQQFVSQIQHELRTPLHCILGLAEILQTSVPAEADAPDQAPVDLSDPKVFTSLLSGIQLAGNNLDSILEDVLDFNQVSALQDSRETLAERVEPVDLPRLLENLASQQLEHLLLTSSVGEGNTAQELSSSLLEPKSIRLSNLIVSVESTLEKSFCLLKSVSRIKKILSQIISNAVRFASDEMVEIRASLVQAESTRLLEVFVKDHGPGMTKAFVETELLRPFRKGSFYRQGTGLGMALAGNLCQLIGGELKVESEIGIGTQVTFVLPLELKSKPEQDLEPLPKVRTACFIGFDSDKSSLRLKGFISSELLSSGIQLCDPVDAEVLICSQDAVALDGVADLASQSNASRRRVVVMTSSLVIPRSSSLLPGIPICTLRLPYGPSMLKALKEFLSFDARPRPERVDSSSIHLYSDVADPVSSLQREKESALTAAAISTVASVLPQEQLEERGEFRVLIVEDNPLNLRLLTTLCQRLKIKTETAVDGCDAVLKFLEFKPALVLLDISLPIQDGFEACVQMRTSQKERNLSYHPRIIAVTALSSSFDRLRAAQVGVDDYRVKPVSMRELRQDLESWRKIWEERKFEFGVEAEGEEEGSN